MAEGRPAGRKQSAWFAEKATVSWQNTALPSEIQKQAIESLPQAVRQKQCITTPASAGKKARKPLNTGEFYHIRMRTGITDVISAEEAAHAYADKNHACDLCGKLLSAHTGGTPTDAEETSQAGDDFNPAVPVACLFLGGGAAAGATLHRRRKKRPVK